MMPKIFSAKDLTSVKAQMKLWASELGFCMIGIAGTDLSQAVATAICTTWQNTVTGGQNRMLFILVLSEWSVYAWIIFLIQQRLQQRYYRIVLEVMFPAMPWDAIIID